MSSLRFRLVVLFMVIEFAVIFAMASLVHHRSSRAMLDAIDAEIMAHVRQFATELEEGEAPEEIASELSEEQRASFARGRDQFYQIVAGDGAVIVRSPSLRDESLPLPEDWEDEMEVGDTEFIIDECDDEEVRIGTILVSASLPRGTSLSGENRGAVTVVQVAFDTEDYRDTQRDLIEYLSMIGGGLLLISLTGGHLLATWGLRPLRRLSDRVRQITAEDLDARLPETGMPRELRPLSSAFNETLARLEEAFERERRFLADASHELRTPISVAMATMEVTLKREREPEQYADCLEKSLRAVIRMKGLVERMLAVARSAGGSPPFVGADVDLIAVVEDVLAFLQPLAESHGIAVKWQRPDRPALALGDRALLEEMIQNLLSNGIVHNRPGGEVTVAITPDDDSGAWVLSVVDTGVGISPEHLPHIFERFYRVDKARSREQGGSGLGLAIAKDIADAHGGEITIESEPGVGTELRVTIPR